MTFKVTLSFETKADAENWIAGYIDGGGDQTLGYDVEESKGFNLILRGYRQCPDCRFGDIGTMQEYKERLTQASNPKKSHKCQNCNFECDEKDIINP